MTHCNHRWQTHLPPQETNGHSHPPPGLYHPSDLGQDLWITEVCTNCNTLRWARYQRDNTQQSFVLNQSQGEMRRRIG